MGLVGLARVALSAYSSVHRTGVQSTLRHSTAVDGSAHSHSGGSQPCLMSKAWRAMTHSVQTSKPDSGFLSILQQLCWQPSCAG